MNMIFLDTVGLVAMWNRADQWHGAAMQAVAAFDSPGTRLVTTSFVLLECGNAAARKLFRSDVDELRRKMEAEHDLIAPTDSDWTEAWAAYTRDAPGGPGIIDHVSFVVMRRLGIADAFTNDRHFKTVGFNTLF